MNKDSDIRVFLNGHIDVPEDRLKAVKSALPQHIALTRAEEGCISFQVVQNDAIPGRFMVSEIFASQTAFDAHQARTKSSKWYLITEGIPREYSVTIGSDESM